MGFESFQVKLRGGNGTPQEVDEAIAAMEHVVNDDDSAFVSGSNYYLLKDSRHAIEIELVPEPLRLSCRFTLCHPPSVDAAFLELVRRFMQRFGMHARICDDVSPDHDRNFSLAEFDEFARATMGYTAARRREWQAAFGIRQLAATTSDVHEQIILPLCQERVEKAG